MDTPQSNNTPQVEFEFSDEGSGMKVRMPKGLTSPPLPQCLLHIPGESEAQERPDQGDDDPMGEQTKSKPEADSHVWSVERLLVRAGQETVPPAWFNNSRG